MSRLRDITIHDCGRIEVVVDQMNGCVQIIGYNSTTERWPEFTVTLFGSSDLPPELKPVTYLDPDVPSLDEAIREYEDKHGV